MNENIRFKHKCEVCGREEMLTIKEAFHDGWDYPPNIGTFGILSPRTCGDCSITQTLWFKYINKIKNGLPNDFDEHDFEVLRQIDNELRDIPKEVFEDTSEN